MGLQQSCHQDWKPWPLAKAPYPEVNHKIIWQGCSLGRGRGTEEITHKFHWRTWIFCFGRHMPGLLSTKKLVSTLEGCQLESSGSHTFLKFFPPLSQMSCSKALSLSACFHVKNSVPVVLLKSLAVYVDIMNIVHVTHSLPISWHTPQVCSQ